MTRTSQFPLALAACGHARGAAVATQPATTTTQTDRPTCRLVVLNKHTPTPLGVARWGGHLGVDYAACADRNIISIGEGWVVFVEPDNPADDSLYYNGGSVQIFHEIPGREDVLLFDYEHLTNITVHVGEQVHRGQVLGEAWGAPP